MSKLRSECSAQGAASERRGLLRLPASRLLGRRQRPRHQHLGRGQWATHGPTPAQRRVAPA